MEAITVVRMAVRQLGDQSVAGSVGPPAQTSVWVMKVEKRREMVPDLVALFILITKKAFGMQAASPFDSQTTFVMGRTSSRQAQFTRSINP